jgi:hypothetical protein
MAAATQGLARKTPLATVAAARQMCASTATSYGTAFSLSVAAAVKAMPIIIKLTLPLVVMVAARLGEREGAITLRVTGVVAALGEPNVTAAWVEQAARQLTTPVFPVAPER